MKKVLALVMVLGMAGIASAGLQFAADDQVIGNGSLVQTNADVIIFAIANETQATGAFDGAFIAIYGPATFGASMIVPGQLPGVWSIQDLGPVDMGDGVLAPVLFMSWDQPAIDPVKAGKFANFEIKGKLNDEGMVKVFNISAEQVYAMNYKFIPEPMTLSLLGLGALVLRRRS